MTPTRSHNCLETKKSAKIDDTIKILYLQKRFCFAARYLYYSKKQPLPFNAHRDAQSKVYNIMRNAFLLFSMNLLSWAACAASLVNSCGIPLGGTTQFHIEVSDNVQQSDLTWNVVSGNVSFVGDDNTGSSVTVKGDGEGPFKIEMRLKHLWLPPDKPFPNFEGRVVEPVTIPVRLCIVHQEGTGATAMTEQTFDAWLSDVNTIYSQVAMTFFRSGETVHITNNTYYFFSEYDPTDTARLLVNTLSGTGGLEIYCVNGFTNNAVIGFNLSGGITIDANRGSGHVIAHEIGHQCGLEDIYDRLVDNNGDEYAFITSPVKAEWMPNDWGGGYYPQGFHQGMLLQRLLMFGYTSEAFPSTKSIARGLIHGYDAEDSLRLVKVGIFEMSTRTPAHH